MEKNGDFKQNTQDKAEFQNIYFMHLLFAERPQRPETEAIGRALEACFGQVDQVSPGPGLVSFAIKKYPVTYKDGVVPAQVVMTEVRDFAQDSIDAFSRSQLWDVQDGEEILASCRYQVSIFDMMSAGLEYKQRCELLMDWLETALKLFADCTAVWVAPAGKLFTAQMVREHGISRADRFVYFGVNARFFNIQGTDDQIVDTLGMYAVGLPDVQYHFHGLDPNRVVNHAYNVASYLFDQDAPIKNGETIDGLLDGEMSREVQWRCQYEDALIQPVRCVMDICPGEYAAGNRETGE
ncbi:MAG: DUF4261 domain-containing protein [Enterocloster asparagiformis]|nr:DUF4261 domain-containing protein [Enterocloster asparagiformis]